MNNILTLIFFSNKIFNDQYFSKFTGGQYKGEDLTKSNEWIKSKTSSCGSIFSNLPLCNIKLFKSNWTNYIN